MKIHDLQKLCDALAGYDLGEADQLQPLVDELAECYTESRYPGFDLEPEDWPGLEALPLKAQEYVSAVLQRHKP